MGKSTDGFSYGLKEILATLLGVAAFVFAEYVELYYIRTGAFPAQTYEWVQFRVLIVAVVAVFFGPFCGVLCGLGGDILINSMFEPVISYHEVIALGLYGFFMGYYHRRTHRSIKQFTTREFLDFNALQIVTGIFCAMFVVPFVKFLLSNANINDSVTVGAKSVAGNSILVGAVCSITMAVISAVYQIKAEKAEDGK